MIVSRLPEARIRGGAWSRLIAGPSRWTSSWVAWAIGVAAFLAVAHVVWFLAIVPLPERGLAGACLLTATIQWTITCAAMAGVAITTRGLARWHSGLAAVVAAMLVAVVAVLIERVAAGAYLGFADETGAPTDGFWVLAAASGAIWGAWLPTAHRRT